MKKIRANPLNARRPRSIFRHQPRTVTRHRFAKRTERSERASRHPGGEELRQN